MKKILLGGFLFLGGAVLFSVGTLGVAHAEVQAAAMQLPQYLGALSMLAGILFGLLGLKHDQ